jgi:hypothetical protein
LTPDLTRIITPAVLIDAIIGYRHLVETNFPSFGPALGMYSILPVHAQATVIIPEDAEQGWAATLRYALHPDTANASNPTPRVEVGLSTRSKDGSLGPIPIFPLEQQTAFHVPTAHETVLSIHLARSATNLAYEWLGSDLRTVGWLYGSLVLHD